VDASPPGPTTLHNATLADVDVDEGISGHIGRDGKPGLDATLTHACKEGAALLVYSWSRLARNTRETIEIGECLAECSTDLVSLSDKIDTTSAAGKTLVASEADRKRLARVRRLYREGKSVRV
jgi:DNA invertase Pin-like site-specific DNA recombinase